VEGHQCEGDEAGEGVGLLDGWRTYILDEQRRWGVHVLVAMYIVKMLALSRLPVNPSNASSSSITMVVQSQ